MARAPLPVPSSPVIAYSDLLHDLYGPDCGQWPDLAVWPVPFWPVPDGAS